jgi:hypothetical protein
MRASATALAGLLAALLAGCTDRGDAVTDPGLDASISFAGQVSPLFAARCVPCHTGGSGAAAGLQFSHGGLLTGGLGGPAVAPGQPDSSLLVQRLESADPNVRMPLGDPPLGASQIGLVRSWIAEGAQDN